MMRSLNFKKPFVIAAAFAAAALPMIGQTSGMISYQGILMNQGKPSTDGWHIMQFRLYSQPDAVEPLWAEEQKVQTEKGLFQVYLGAIKSLPTQIPNSLYLGLSLPGQAEFARIPLTGVPYAIHAATSQASRELLPGAKGAVASINGIQGSIGLQGADGLEIRKKGENALEIGLSSATAKGEHVLGVDEWNLAGNSSISSTAFLGTTSNQSLPIRTNNIERLRITNTGNIGIGTTNPGTKLAIAGTVSILPENNTTPELRLGTAAGSWSTILKTATQSANITYTLPAAIGNNGDILTTDNTGKLSWAALQSWNMTGNALTGTTAFLGTTNNTALPIRTNNTERMRITANGAVGINKVSPTERLEVAGNILVEPISASSGGELRLRASTNGFYTAFRAQSQNSNIIYRLPASYGNPGDVLTTDGSTGVLSWAPAAGGGKASLEYFKEGRSNITEARPTISWSPIDDLFLGQPVNIALIPRQGGAIIAAEPDNAVLGGNERGQFAVDLQMKRFSRFQIAAGNYSVISGGRNNLAGSLYSVIAGGIGNEIPESAIASTISGGRNNYMQSDAGLGIESFSSVIGGGEDNFLQGNVSVIGGGLLNTVNGYASGISSGQENSIVGADYSIIAGGFFNSINDGNYSFIGGGAQNQIVKAFGEPSSSYSVIAGGEQNIISKSRSVIAGGDQNSISAPNSGILSGSANTISGRHSAILAGELNTSTENYGLIGSGVANNSGGIFATVLNGSDNKANADNSLVLGGNSLEFTGAAQFSMGFLGQNGADRPMSISAPRTGVLANIDLWLANNDGTPRSLRFFSDTYTSTGGYPDDGAGAYAYSVSMKAPAALAADYTLVLPPNDGSANDVLITDGSGNTAWSSDFARLSTDNTFTKTITINSSTDDGLIVQNGRTVLSAASYNSGQTIDRAVSVAHVNNNGTGSSASITLPTSPSAGQIMYLTCDDPQGLNVTNVSITFTGITDKVLCFVYSGGSWRYLALTVIP
jgi:hypothetical protein